MRAFCISVFFLLLFWIAGVLDATGHNGWAIVLGIAGFGLLHRVVEAAIYEGKS